MSQQFLNRTFAKLASPLQNFHLSWKSASVILHYFHPCIIPEALSLSLSPLAIWFASISQFIIFFHYSSRCSSRNGVQELSLPKYLNLQQSNASGSKLLSNSQFIPMDFASQAVCFICLSFPQYARSPDCVPYSIAIENSGALRSHVENKESFAQQVPCFCYLPIHLFASAWDCNNQMHYLQM